VNKRMMFMLVAVCFAGAALPAAAADPFDRANSLLRSLAASFADPPLQYRSRPFHWLNAPLKEAELRTQIRAMRDECGFGGFSPLPMNLTRPKYLTDDYFRLYGVMLEEAEKLGLTVDFYDDIDYPAGSVGGVIAAQHPQHLMKNLRQAEQEVAGGSTVEAAVPEGRLMAVVAMETTTKQRVNLAPLLEGDKLRWTAPDGRWKVMFFSCVPEGHVIDYLDPVAVDLFIDLTYGEYERRFGRHFGTTITQAFTDDVALYYTSGQRAWTYDFNAKFEQRHGMDPTLLYPALWHDIGPETEAARVALFGLRAELFSEVFVRKLHEWCKARGGKTYFAQQPSSEALQAILDDAVPVADVVFENTPRLRSGGGMLSYLHKVKDGTNIYHFANSTNDRVDTWVRLRGKMTLQAWDPHSGAMTAADCKHETDKGQDVTRMRLVLAPVKSVFLIGPAATESDTPRQWSNQP